MSEHGPKGSFLRWLRGAGDDAEADAVARFDADAVERSLRGIGRLYGTGGYFPLAFEGWQHVPDAPSMLVMNHSGGTSIPDVWGFVAGWYRHFGTARPLHVLGHEMLFAAAPMADYLARRGVLRATPRNAVSVLRDHRRDLLVAPGGDRDVWRPWSQRYRVVFDGRRGYARTALACGVPMVPVAHVGAHHSLVVLTDGRRFARWFGLQRHFRAEVFPVHLSLPWGLAVGPWPHLPLPIPLRYRFGPAQGAHVADATVPDDDAVRAADASVRDAIQSMLDRFRDEDARTNFPRARTVGA